MIDRIHVEESSLDALRNALAGAGEEYKRELARLSNLVDEIASGDIEGDVATDFREKFEAKREDFKKITEAIDKAEEYVGVKGTSFVDMVTELKDTNK